MTSPSAPPSGTQHTITDGDWTAIVTETGGSLRSLTYAGRDLLDGYPATEMATGGRGQQLIPWPNRIEDGSYTFEGRDLQLALSEVPLRNASHGLVRWTSWTCQESSASSVTMGYRLAAQTGYPWSLELRTTYALGSSDKGGLSVRWEATNLADSVAPFAAGFHPYLLPADGVDSAILTLPAAERWLTDERNLPTTPESVDGTDADFRSPRLIGATVLDHPFTGLSRDADGKVRARVDDVEVWADECFGWLQVFTEPTRRAIAIEPMTAPPNAFRSGTDLIRLQPGETFTGAWGISRV